MINIPSEVAVNALLKQGCMVRAGPNTLFPTTKNHCAILLNKTPLEDEYLVFVSASSQYTKRIDYALRIGLPSTTIVMIRPNTYLHLPKYTAVDCNFVYTITRGMIVTLYEEDKIRFYKTHPNVNDTHLELIIKGVNDSPLVVNEVKKVISPR